MKNNDEIFTTTGGHVGGKFSWRSDPRARAYDDGFLEIIDELGLRIDWASEQVVEKSEGE